MQLGEWMLSCLVALVRIHLLQRSTVPDFIIVVLINNYFRPTVVTPSLLSRYSADYITYRKYRSS